jgi:phosphonoacetate hydrolase
MVAAMLPMTATAQQQARPTPQPVTAERVEATERRAPPRLIVAISVDQFSADLFTEYRPYFRGGLARLSRGVVFPQGYQAQAATETCPGHSTILTGSHPARTGIVANNWYDLSLTREDRRVYCSEDPTVAGTTSSRYAPSINYLLVPTLGDRMRAANPAAQVVSVAGKDRAAIMLGGRAANETWWLAPSGLASYRGVTGSAAVESVRGAIASILAEPRTPVDLPTVCASRDIAVALPDGRSVGTGRFARAAGDMRNFSASPEADGSVLAAAMTLRNERRLGEGATTDLLSIGLSATDYVGHRYGTGGAEMCAQLMFLDQELGDFFTDLDATGIDYAVVLTADHGGHDIAERNRQNAIPSAERLPLSPGGEVDERGNRMSVLDALPLSNRIAAETGLTGVGQLLYADSPFGDYYISRTLTPAQATQVRAAALRIFRSTAQVAAVFTADELAAMPIPTASPELWSVADRVRASFHRGRSGDIYVALRPRVVPIAAPSDGYIATHGSVWDYDRRVPILFWRRGMTGFEQPNPVMTVDILPTLAALIGLPIPAGEIDGRCLDLISGPGDSCAR